jgi:PAS domain S-box-containing protein
MDEWAKRVHPDDLAPAMAAVQAHLDGTTPSYTNEHRISCKDGSWQWIHDRGLVIERDAAGKPVRMIGMHEDISVRKQAEKALHESEESYRTLFDRANDGIFLLAADGRLVSVNQSFARMHGYSVAEMLQMHLQDLDTPATQQEAPQRIARLLAGEALSFEVEHYHKDGHLIQLEVSASLIYFGSQAMIQCFHRDITERKQIEMFLRQSRSAALNMMVDAVAARDQAVQMRTALEDKSAELERFLYTASHDLKSPVVTIRTFLGYLQQNLAAADAAKIANDLHFLNAAAGKLSSMLNELLEISRVGRAVNQPVRVTFRDLVDEALGAVAGTIAAHGVTVEVGGHAVTLLGDRPRLAEIWQNLLENACKFMGGQPAPRIEIGVEARAAATVFFVRDNGIGLDPRHHAKIFNLFEKLDPNADGTGFGLAIIKRIVEIYRGRVWVESKGAGHGACFYFTLPDALQYEPPMNRP